jgi:hypothetical protein
MDGLVAARSAKVSRFRRHLCAGNCGTPPQFACSATKLPLFPEQKSAAGGFRALHGVLFYSLFKDTQDMRKIILAAAIAGAALSVAACSSQTADSSTEAADAAAADVSANADAAASAVTDAASDAAGAVADAASNAAEATSDAAATGADAATSAAQ